MPKLSKDEMSARYKEAKRYIQIKKFDEARKLLATIDHPKARELMDSLPAPKRRRPLAVRLLVAFLVVVVVGAVALVVNSTRENQIFQARFEEQQALEEYCIDLHTGRLTDEDIDSCYDWARDTGAALHGETARACLDASAGLESRVHQCLLDEKVSPPGFLIR